MKILLDVSAFQNPGQLDYLLAHAPDEIVGVYIKATQGTTYRNELAGQFALICEKHKTPFGYYHFMTNEQADQQAMFHKSFVASLPPPHLKTLLDCEAGYNKYAIGVEHFSVALGLPVALYAQLSNMPHYAGLQIPKIVAQYDAMYFYRPQPGEVAAYKNQGYAGWQWTSAYLGGNQDASILLDDDLSRLRA